MEDNVILYHQHGCGMCATVERMLKLKNVNFVSVTDIEEMRAKGITHTPILVVNGEELIGKAIID